jgi:hypothetical protein
MLSDRTAFASILSVRLIRMATVPPSTTRTSTPSIANGSTSCADVVAHRTREPASGGLDGAFTPKQNPVRPIKLLGLVQRCLCRELR